MTTAPPGGPVDGATPRSDAEVEAVLTHRTGQQVPPHLEQDVLAVAHLRQSLMTVAPAPSAELTLLLSEGSPRRSRTPRLVGAAGWFVGLGMGAQVGLASAAAAAALVAAGSAHVLPGPVQDAYDSFAAFLQPEDDDQGRELPGEVGTGPGNGSGTSTTDLAPNATRPDLEPDREPTGAQDDGGEAGTPGAVPSDGGASGPGAGAQPAGGPPAPGPAAGGGPGAGPSGSGGTHPQTDDEDDQDEAEEAADEAADAAEDAADEAEDAQDEAEDAEEEAAEAAEDADEDEDEEEREDDEE